MNRIERSKNITMELGKSKYMNIIYDNMDIYLIFIGVLSILLSNISANAAIKRGRWFGLKEINIKHIKILNIIVGLSLIVFGLLSLLGIIHRQ